MWVKSVWMCMALMAVVATAGSVRVLTDSDFNDVVDGNRHVFVKFFAPWCGHCKSVAPTWEKLAKGYQGKDEVVIAEVDCTEQATLCAQHEVQGYPTLKYYAKGQTEGEGYQGGRELDNFLEFVHEKSGVAGEKTVDVVFTQELTPETFDAVALNPAKSVLVAFVAPWCGHCKNLHPTYDALAEIYRNDPNVVIARVNADAHRSLGERFGVQGFPTIKMFAAGSADKEAEAYEGERSLDALAAFIGKHAVYPRASNGRLMPTVGLVQALEDAAADFFDGDSAAFLAQAEAYAAEHPDSRPAKLYVHTMKKLIADSSYLEREITRLSNMIDSGMVPADKVDDMDIRLNILKSFQN